MTGFIVGCVYIGGIQPTYVKSKGLGNSRIEAFFDAVFWPLGLGRFLVRFWEDA